MARKLGLSPSTAWRLKHQHLLDPDLIQHVAKTIADKTLLCANAAVDTFLDQADNGELSKQTPIQLAKAASVLLQASGAYAALSGARDTFSAIVSEYGITPSHATSRVTVEQKITVESATHSTPEPHVLDISTSPACETEAGIRK